MLYRIDRSTSLPPAGTRRNAIVSIVVGEPYTEIWNRVCKATWEAYADRHGYDIVIITDLLDSTARAQARSPSWQKLLVLSQPWAKAYDRIVWIDADIIISPGSPDILASVPDPTKVGLSKLGDQLSIADRQVYVERLHGLRVPPDQADEAWSYIAQYGLRCIGVHATDLPMYNCGVLVASPDHHARLFLDVYARDGETRGYEQPHLSHALFEVDAAQVISPRFNWNVHESLIVNFPMQAPVTAENFPHILFQLRNDFDKAYFLHFAGSLPLLKIVADMTKPGESVLGHRIPAPLARRTAADDFVSPGLARVAPDAHFPDMVIGDPARNAWSFLRRASPHPWYVDRRFPQMGFVSRDEANLLYNLALQAKGKPALEVGTFLGWSACHLALAGVQLDLVDPGLADPRIADSVTASLKSAGVWERCRFVPAGSPGAVISLGEGENRRWNLIFIDGDHEGSAPLRDAEACARFAADDCIVIFHDLLSPHVAEGLRHYRRLGWNTRLYHTSQVMGVAWRGAMRPVQHYQDPRLGTWLPDHLDDLRS